MGPKQPLVRWPLSARSGLSAQRIFMSIPIGAIRLASAHAYVRSAQPFLASPPPWDIPQHMVDLQEIEGVLPEELLIAFMDKLAGCGLQESPRGGFWRNMEKAASV